MEDLPSEIHLRIFTHLEDGDLIKLPSLNHYFNNLLHDESIWRDRMKKWIYNYVVPQKPAIKNKYIEILRSWPKEIPDARIHELTKDHGECLCKYHIYSNGELLKCFEYMPIAVLKLAKYQIPELWLPLQFWFNQNPGLALPVVAVPYHNIQIDLNDEDD